jgi:hypothetical protein
MPGRLAPFGVEHSKAGMTGRSTAPEVLWQPQDLGSISEYILENFQVLYYGTVDGTLTSGAGSVRE